MKINNILIEGIRGVKENLTLALNEKSILIYGDNGMGKSTISDSLEWFFKDDVSHLSGEEIDLKEALRNSYIPETKKSSVDISFSTPTFNSQRSLEFKKSKLVTEYSNKNDVFINYLKASSKENLLLRHKFLTDFIDKTKADKLKSLSEIIGFSEVTKVKETLRKAYSTINTEIKNQNFESQINTQKVTLKENLGSVMSVEENLFKEINEVCKPLKIDIEVKSFADIDTLLNKLKSRTNAPLINEQKFLETCKNSFSILKGESSMINQEYNKYYTEFNIIAKDVQSIMQIYFAELLKAGKQLIDKKFHKEDNCPLCQQNKKRDELLSEIEKRLLEIEKASSKKLTYDSAKQGFTTIIESRIKKIEFLLNEPLIKEEANKYIKENIDSIVTKLKAFQKAAVEKVSSGNLLLDPKELLFSENDFSALEKIEARINIVKATIAKDNSTTIFSKISFAKDAFSKIKKFEAEKAKLDKQRLSLEIIYN